MNVHIEFNTDNAAFVDAWVFEVERILNQAKSTINDFEKNDIVGAEVTKRLVDTNGNSVGTVVLRDE